MEKNSSPSFKILWVNTCTLGVLNRSFLGRLWVEVLGTAPVVKTIEMLDDDILCVGTPPEYTGLMIDTLDKGKLTGHIVMWVDDLEAAAAWLESRHVPFSRSTAGYDGLEIDRTYLGENVCVRLDQIPEQILELHRSLHAALQPR
ncbi:MAG: hypothetical protein WC641_05875 [Patescibacteria group bacterium]